MNQTLLLLACASIATIACGSNSEPLSPGSGGGGSGSSLTAGAEQGGTSSGGVPAAGGMPAGGTSAAGAGNGGSGGGSGSATGATAGTGAGGGGAAAVGGAGGSGGAAGGAVVDPGPEGDGEVEVGPSYPNGPVEDLRDRGSAKGRSFRFQVESQDSKFYQGDDATLNTKRAFSRRIDVYVPVQYKAGKPAPLLVIHDGPGQLGLVSRALDNLTISTDPQRRLPAFVAIAVANGGGDSKGSQRGLEYDTMSDRFVRFINEEVLPAVENNAEIKQAYPGFKLTTDPEGRATMGCSSGGAAALTMGWFRPDLFHRLITYSGTFVDQQDDDAAEEKTYPLGAWEYHSGMKLIQNADKKPLRIFLHHSDADNGANAPESGHHNWVMANQRTAAALKEKGYHYRHLTAKSAGHCDGDVFNATLADTLVWAWRGYPTD